MSFPKKAFVFPNNRISKARICCQCWFKKISWKRTTKQQKKLRGNVFLLSPRSHAKIELNWTRTKICPKKSLTSFLQEALQLLQMGQTGFSCLELIFAIFRKWRSSELITFSFFIEYVHSKYRWSFFYKKHSLYQVLNADSNFILFHCINFYYSGVNFAGEIFVVISFTGTFFADDEKKTQKKPHKLEPAKM